MTNEEYIKSLSREEYIKSLSRRELAKLLIRSEERPEYEYDWDDNLYECGSLTWYITSDGEEFWEGDYNYAVQHECHWLSKNMGEKAGTYYY